MDYQPDRPCVGCGATISRGYGKPAGEACCRKCRAAGVAMVHGTEGAYRRQGCRCDQCREVHNAAMREYAAKFRQKTGRGLSRVYRPAGYRSPTSRNWIPDETRAEIYARDAFVCGICDVPVDKAAHWNDDAAATLDHIIPKSLGGSDEPTNLRCAHRICNSRRGNRVDVSTGS